MIGTGAVGLAPGRGVRMLLDSGPLRALGCVLGKG